MAVVTSSLIGTILWLQHNSGFTEHVDATITGQHEVKDDRGASCFLDVRYFVRETVYTATVPIGESCGASASNGSIVGLLINPGDRSRLPLFASHSGAASFTALGEFFILGPALAILALCAFRLRSLTMIYRTASSLPWRQLSPLGFRYVKGPGGRLALKASIASTSGEPALLVLSGVGRWSIGSLRKRPTRNEPIWIAGDLTAPWGRVLLGSPRQDFVSVVTVRHDNSD
ncbi:hypothetical protein AHiyo1_51780 [Arthrobacter sp. Hiyo1]|nr:hypothetical protein AHiyo1_51780 [Arthrobacter sp. Hiyo1]